MNNLFIPDKIRVGFQKREDTYTKKLAYVVFYKDGKIAKEKSWNDWCTIPGKQIYNRWRNETYVVENDPEVDLTPFDVENKPHSGFVLNKGVQRYGYWGGGRNMVRVYDDRGIEFEITIDNLMFILMTTNCHKRGLEGEFVYAWGGHQNKNLILLPVGCEEYQESLSFTKIQDKVITKKELVPGCAYTRKDQVQMIYLGEFDWYGSLSDKRVDRRHVGKTSKVHIFSYKKAAKWYDYDKQDWVSDDNYTEYFTTKKLDKVATKDTDIPVTNFAELIDEFKMHKLASAPVEIVYEDKEIEFLDDNRNYFWYSQKLSGIYYLQEEDGNFYGCEISEIRGGDKNTKLVGYNVTKTYSIHIKGHQLNRNYKYDYNDKIYSKDELKALNFKDIFIKLESGKMVKYWEY